MGWGAIGEGEGGGEKEKEGGGEEKEENGEDRTLLTQCNAMTLPLMHSQAGDSFARGRCVCVCVNKKKEKKIT